MKRADITETQASSGPEFRFATGLNLEVWDFATLALKTRFAKALDEGTSRYPIYRSLRFAARKDLEALFDDLALRLGWRAQRMDSSSMILDSEGLFISAHGGRKADYCSCRFGI